MSEVLSYKLFYTNDYSFTVSTLIILTIFWIITIAVLKLLKKIIYRNSKFDTAKKYAIYSLLKYFLLVISIAISFQILGFNLSVLLAGSAALLVGVGLGLQSIFSDFISGIILLVDSSVKVNDIIEVNNIVGQVQEISLRTTTVITRDDKYIILPNSQLTKNNLINWTHSSVTSRFEIEVGVDYSSDVNLVMKLLKEAAENHSKVLKAPLPAVRFSNYGNSSLDFTLLFWSDEVFRIENIKSEIRVSIYKLFKENNVVIPFPQRVVHLKN